MLGLLATVACLVLYVDAARQLRRDRQERRQLADRVEVLLRTAREAERIAAEAHALCRPDAGIAATPADCAVRLAFEALRDADALAREIRDGNQRGEHRGRAPH